MTSPIYEHSCRDCKQDWLEEYTLDQFDWLKTNGIDLACVHCNSENTFRCVSRVPVHFKGGGVGWADNGYYKYEAYDQHQREGKKVEVYERKEDIERVMKGEKREAVKARLKQENELAKKYFGPDAGMTEAQAEKRIRRAVDKVKVEDGSSRK